MVADDVALFTAEELPPYAYAWFESPTAGSYLRFEPSSTDLAFTKYCEVHRLPRTTTEEARPEAMTNRIINRDNNGG